MRDELSESYSSRYSKKRSFWGKTSIGSSLLAEWEIVDEDLGSEYRR